MSTREALVAVSLFAVSALVVSPAHAGDATARPQTLRYSYVVAGELAGRYQRSALGDGSHVFRFEHGTGHQPALLETRVQFDSDWFPTMVVRTGTDLAGNDVSEMFSIESGVAQWHREDERGTAFASPRRFYSTSASMLDESCALVLAARGARDGCIDLLPSGRACVRKATEERVLTGSEGQTVHAWAIWGVGNRPIVVWLDDDGELFATVSAWASALREGWEDVDTQLLDAQDRWLALELSRRDSDRPAGSAVRHGERRPIFP